jgi:hypothetical protein
MITYAGTPVTKDNGPKIPTWPSDITHAAVIIFIRKWVLYTNHGGQSQLTVQLGEAAKMLTELLGDEQWRRHSWTLDDFTEQEIIFLLWNRFKDNAATDLTESINQLPMLVFKQNKDLAVSFAEFKTACDVVIQDNDEGQYMTEEAITLALRGRIGLPRIKKQVTQLDFKSTDQLFDFLRTTCAHGDVCLKGLKDIYTTSELAALFPQKPGGSTRESAALAELSDEDESESGEKPATNKAELGIESCKGCGGTQPPHRREECPNKAQRYFVSEGKGEHRWWKNWQAGEPKKREVTKVVRRIIFRQPLVSAGDMDSVIAREYRISDKSHQPPRFEFLLTVGGSADPTDTRKVFAYADSLADCSVMPAWMFERLKKVLNLELLSAEYIKLESASGDAMHVLGTVTLSLSRLTSTLMGEAKDLLPDGLARKITVVVTDAMNTHHVILGLDYLGNLKLYEHFAEIHKLSKEKEDEERSARGSLPVKPGAY